MDRKPYIFTEEELREKCAEWQRRLRLQDWIVHVSIYRERDFSKSGRSGEINWTLTKKQASILMLDPLDYGTNTILPQDMEQDLVHELLHLLFAPFCGNLESDSLEHIIMEQTINTISDALVDLARKEEEFAPIQEALSLPAVITTKEATTNENVNENVKRDEIRNEVSNGQESSQDG